MRFVKYNWKVIVVDDPCRLHTIETNKHDVSRLRGGGGKEKIINFSSFISQHWKYLKYRSVLNFYFNDVLNSFSLCITVGVVSVIVWMICSFIMYLTKWPLLKHRPRLGKTTSISMVIMSWTVIITFIIIVFVGYMAVSWFCPHCHWLHHQIHRAVLWNCLGSLCYCRRMTQCEAVRPGGKDIYTTPCNPCHCSRDGWCLWLWVEHIVSHRVCAPGIHLLLWSIHDLQVPSFWLCNMALKPYHCLEQCPHDMLLEGVLCWWQHGCLFVGCWSQCITQLIKRVAVLSPLSIQQLNISPSGGVQRDAQWSWSTKLR